MRPVDFDIEKLIEYTKGTCEPLYQTLETVYPGMSEDELTSEDLEALDNEIFKCDECGWWFEISEQAESDSGDAICLDCHG